jgi:hypothetical protein
MLLGMIATSFTVQNWKKKKKTLQWLTWLAPIRMTETFYEID